MDALDARHFNVGGGGRTRKKRGRQSRGGLEAIKCLRHSFDDIFHANKTKMVIGHQRYCTPALPRDILQNNRASQRDGYRRSGDDPIESIERCRGEAPSSTT
jgi:hypothetical protein